MRKMSIDFNMIKSEVENLARELNRYGITNCHIKTRSLSVIFLRKQ